ncbi:uncharacterized protein LOC124163740 [Ischnura elegans]|uniref:uncharacterized protein LOC124163740 n=1 Tax=Ischnura elegans TaxID=197161 RepID=UPI001ED8ACC6|nr:uncharacterized protein LOC124163740 [Ischnura elegans]
MENGDEERHSQTNGDAKHNNDCGKQEDASTSSIDSSRELGARRKKKCIPYNIPSVNNSDKLNNADSMRRSRRRRILDHDKVNTSHRLGNSVHEEDVSESDEDEINGPTRQRNGYVKSAQGVDVNDKTEDPNDFQLDSYIRNNVAGFEPNLNKCPDKKEDSDSKVNLSSDSDNDGDVEDEEDDGLSADECCIYTYRGDREGVADLPYLFGVDGQEADNVANVDAMVNIGRRLGDVPPPRCSSPEMDFLEMDFDPGPPTGRDSDESGRDSQEECDGAEVVCGAVNPEVAANKQINLEVKDIPQKKCHNEEVCLSVGRTSPPSTMSPSPPPFYQQSSNNLSLPHVEKEENQEENLLVSSQGAMSYHTSKPNLPTSGADNSKGAVPKVMQLNLVTEARAPSNSLWTADSSFEGCRRRQCLGVIRQDMDRPTRGLIFAGLNGCESHGVVEPAESMHQTNLLDSSVNSPSYYVPVYICLPMQKHSPNKSQPKLLQIQTNSILANCRGHRKVHGDHLSSVSDRGAADVIVHALSALDVPVPCAKVQQGLCMAMPSGYSGKSAPPNGLVEYLEWRANCKGAPSQIEIAKTIEWSSEGAVVSRFFPASSSPSNGCGSARCCSFSSSSNSTCPESASSSFSSKAQMAGVNLMDWLYYWMKRGAVPIVTLNSQDWIDCIKASGAENPDHNKMCGYSERSGGGSNCFRGGVEEGERWVHQMVIGLGPRGAYLSGCANEQCCAEVRSLACLLVSGETKGVHVGRAEVVARWRAGSNDLWPLTNPKIPEWRRANVLGAVVSAVRESCSSVSRSTSSSSASTSSSSSTSATPPAISPASPLGVSASASLSSPSSNSPYIVLPVARHRTGITLVLRKDSQALEELLAAPDAALSHILSPNSNSIPHTFENAPSNAIKTTVCAPTVNGKPFSSHASLPKPQTRSQDSN